MSLVPSEYPTHAIEFQLTVLVPVTEENRSDVDGVVYDTLNAAGLTWWPDRVAEFQDFAQVLMYGFNRPPQFKRPRPKRKAKARA